MSQVISLMKLEDEFLLEAMDQVLNQGKKKKNYPATWTKWADLVGDDGRAWDHGFY